MARQKSRSLKRQLKKRRDLDARGAVRLRTSSPGAELEHHFDEFLRVEAAGWKGREGTAIASKPQTEAEYRGFARAAAELGWLRLTLLALEDTVIAGSLDISVGGELFTVKAGFDEAYARPFPRARAQHGRLRGGHRGGSAGGRPDGSCRGLQDGVGRARVQPRQRLRVLRGPVGRAAQRGWNAHLHPRLVKLRDRAREDPELGRRLERLQNLAKLERLQNLVKRPR